MKQYRSTVPKMDGTIVKFIATDISALCWSFLQWHKPVEEELGDWVNIAQIQAEVSRQGYTFGRSATVSFNGPKRLAHCYL